MSLQTYAELLDLPAAEELVDGLLIENSVVTVVGAPGSSKTWLAVDLAMAIATGKPTFLGLPIRIHGPVVYVVGEGRGRFKFRTLGWQQHHGVTGPVPFFWHNGPVSLADENPDGTWGKEFGPFLEEVKALKPVLVVIDTYARCMPEDENETKAAGAAVRALDALRQSGATVLVLHHLNASGTRERGNTSLKGAVDTQLWLEEKKGHRVSIRVNKQKDLDIPEHPFEVMRRVIGVEGYRRKNGEPQTSCVLEIVDAGGTDMSIVEDRHQVLERRVLRYLERCKDGLSKTKLADKIEGRRQDVMETIDRLVVAGDIVALPKGKNFVLKARQAGLPLTGA